MAQLSSMSAADPTTAFGLNTYKIITHSHPVVVAANLHLLTTVVPPNNIGAPTYRFKVGICQVVDKPLDSITQFDVLRAWIPSKVKELDIAEAMNMSTKEACEMIVNEQNPKLNEQVDIPDDLN